MWKPEQTPITAFNYSWTASVNLRWGVWVLSGLHKCICIFSSWLQKKRKMKPFLPQTKVVMWMIWWVLHRSDAAVELGCKGKVQRGSAGAWWSAALGQNRATGVTGLLLWGLSWWALMMVDTLLHGSTVFAQVKGVLRRVSKARWGCSLGSEC